MKHALFPIFLLVLLATAVEPKLTPRELVRWQRYQQDIGALLTDQSGPESSSGRPTIEPR